MDVLYRSQLFSQEIYKVVCGRNAPSSLQGSIAGGSFDAVLEHHRSIILLAERRLFGSAFALLRPMFDGCINGLWATHLATDSELKQFEENRLTIKPPSVINRLKKKLDTDYTGTLQRVYDQAWKVMSSYVHGGFVQVVRRNAPEFIGPNYTSEEIAEMLELANSMAVLAVMEIPNFSNDPSFVEEAMNVAKNYADGRD